MTTVPGFGLETDTTCTLADVTIDASNVNPALREGLRPFGAGQLPEHPIQKLSRSQLRSSEEQRMKMAGAAYGLHAPMRMRMERTLLAQFQRAPTLGSSLSGLHTIMDLDEVVQIEDCYNRMEDCPDNRMHNKSIHELMEARLGM
mmetsp:Transcript_30033/g.72116  ORF Transcript_30033/g.72116 Transcript_30033/m.72116 type:complete len:145 (+) Transcript_30033:50-484(+)